MQTPKQLDIISDLIKYTQSDSVSISSDELIRIGMIINKMDIDHINIHCVFKLIANITKFKFVIDSKNVCFNYDIRKLMFIALGSDIIEDSYDYSDSSDSSSDISPGTTPETHLFLSIPDKISQISDDIFAIDDIAEELPKIKKKVPDGDIISLVNILCSKKYNMINVALKLVNRFSVHKTSSYVPIFKALIDSDFYDELKKFYYVFLDRNKKIIQHNRKIKEFNHKVRLYNEKIKLMKRKFVEIMTMNDEISKIDIKNSSHISITQAFEHISDSTFNDVCPRNERNLIELPSSVIKNMISIATTNNDTAFIHVLMENISEPTMEIISALNVYFTKENYETIYASITNGKCMCCNKIVPNNIISESERHDIMQRISSKILSTSVRHDNGVLISKSERSAIVEKWTEFTQLLSSCQFDLIIDGANLGYVSAKGGSDINIKLIQNTVKDIISKTNKKVLLIIHQRHTQKIRQLSLPKSVMDNLRIYTTPNNVNDDWFWLYASLYSKSYILTNDQSRDHGCMVAYQNEIKKWIQTYQINIDMETLFIPTTVYESKYSIITPGIFLSDSVIHIVLGNETSRNCICVHLR